MNLGSVTDGLTVQMAQTKLTVMKDVPMINLIVVMDHVSMTSGNVMAGQTVPMAQTKLTVAIHHAKIKDYGTVAMASVSQHHMYVMDQVSSVTPDGDLTVLMARTKV